MEAQDAKNFKAYITSIADSACKEADDLFHAIEYFLEDLLDYQPDDDDIDKVMYSIKE